MPNLALRTEAVLAGKDIQAAILPDPLAAYAVQQGATSSSTIRNSKRTIPSPSSS